MTRTLDPVHPGEILAEEFLVPLGVTQYRLAKDTSVPARRINEIVKGQRAITADTALRLARYFGTSDLFWLNLQARYDLETQKDRLGDRLEVEVNAFQYPAVSRSRPVLGAKRSALVRKVK
jgi:antitoxin HigA-1